MLSARAATVLQLRSKTPLLREVLRCIFVILLEILFSTHREMLPLFPVITDRVRPFLWWPQTAPRSVRTPRPYSMTLHRPVIPRRVLPAGLHSQGRSVQARSQPVAVL